MKTARGEHLENVSAHRRTREFHAVHSKRLLHKVNQPGDVRREAALTRLSYVVKYHEIEAGFDSGQKKGVQSWGLGKGKIYSL